MERGFWGWWLGAPCALHYAYALACMVFSTHGNGWVWAGLVLWLLPQSSSTHLPVCVYVERVLKAGCNSTRAPLAPQHTSNWVNQINCARACTAINVATLDGYTSNALTHTHTHKHMSCAHARIGAPRPSCVATNITYWHSVASGLCTHLKFN